MDLTLGQLSTLAEMGIPVWELRRHEISELDSTQEATINSTEIDEQLLQCDWLVLIDKHAHNEQAQRLLQAMLATIGLSIESVVIVTQEQLPQLQYLSVDRKVLLAFGQAAAQLVLDEKITLDDCLGKVHQTLTSKLTTVVIFGLEELLNNPENKVLAWQDLQLAKSTHQQLGQS